MTKGYTLTIDRVVENTIAALHKLRPELAPDADELLDGYPSGTVDDTDRYPALPRPDDATAERLVRSIVTGNNELRYTATAAQRVRLLARSRKNATLDEEEFLALVKFHRGGGYLAPYMMARLRLDEDTFERLDTLAQVFIIANGGRCRAAERWAEVLGK